MQSSHRTKFDKTLLVAVVCILISTLKTAASADDWPQWQGPQRNAISTDTGLLQKWRPGGPPLAWRVDGLGGGDSAPAVVGGKVFGLSNRDGDEIVWARSEADGKEIWFTSLGAATEQRVPQSKEGPGGTPSVDDNRLYVIGMSGRVACLNVKDGKVIWQKSLIDDFGGVPPMWNFRESPLVDGEKLICTPGSTEAMIVALNKLTGKTIWKSKSQKSVSESGAEPSGQTQARSRVSRRETNNNGTPAMTGTKTPELFLSEHWGMTGFAYKVPNGKYLTNLYFAETFSGIRGEGDRVFTFDVEGNEFRDFDIWKKAGGPRKAYVESVPVEVKDGELTISFRSQTQSPAIKAIEIIPQGERAKDSETIRVKAGESKSFKDSTGNTWLADTGFIGGGTSPGVFSAGGGGRGFGGRGFGGGARSGAAYSSVIAIDFEGQRQYVQLTAKSLVGVSAQDGKVLWQYEKPANGMGINCSTPIFHKGLIFAASAYGAGGGAVKLVKNDSGQITADEVYFTSSMQNHHGGMIVTDGCLYGANGGNGGGYLACLDFQTGKILWRDRKGPKGSLLLADGRLYLRGEDDGELLLIEPSPEGLIERGRFDQPDRSNAKAWAHPIIANGKLFIRDQGLLLCYDVRAK